MNDNKPPAKTDANPDKGRAAPTDDGAADHLVGIGIPNVVLMGTNGTVDLGALPGLAILYCYPATGVPGQAAPEGWDDIPGASGCTLEANAFRDQLADLTGAGADHVHGISAQTPDALCEARERLGLAHSLLSDENGTLRDGLRLPTFEAGGQRLLKRLTMAVRDGTIVWVDYPVHPPEAAAGHALSWLEANRD